MLLAMTLAAAATAAVAASGIPRACEWTEWQSVSSRICHWQNKTVGVLNPNSERQENRFVTYCSQVTRTRRRRCEEGGEGDGQVQFDYKQPTAFLINEHPDGEPVPMRSPDDQCPEEKCSPLHGQWCYWIVSSSCDYLCRHAAKNETEVYIQKRRLCSCPRPRNKGKPCEGFSSERERCECVSLGASFASFLRTTEGILIACGIGAIVMVLIACCVSRVCCDTDDGTEDFKISELPQAQRQQHQEPLLLNLDQSGASLPGFAETDLCSLTAEATVKPTTDSTGTAVSSDGTAGSMVVRLPSHASQVPPPLPPKRYKEKQQQQQQQQQQELRSRRQLSFDLEPPLKYTPPFPNEV